MEKTIEKTRETFTKLFTELRPSASGRSTEQNEKPAVNKVQVGPLAKEDINLQSKNDNKASVRSDHVKCVAFLAISEIEKGKFDEDVYPKPDLEVASPKEISDLQLGDKVKIECSNEELLRVHEEKCGRVEGLDRIIDSEGIVVEILSKYANSVTVHFPKVSVRRSIYRSALKKIHSSHPAELNMRWKVGDVVQTVSQTVLKMLQGRLVKTYSLDVMPLTELAEKKGKVTATSKYYVYVTFDGIRSHIISDSALIECKQTSEPVFDKRTHPRGFKVGDKAKMISNLKILISNQKGNGVWHAAMSQLSGQEVTVVYLHKDGSLGVQIKDGWPWVVNSDSVIKEGEKTLKSDAKTMFIPGDVVTFKYPETPRAVEAYRKPFCGRVSGVDRNEWPVVRFQALQTHINPHYLIRASDKGIEDFRQKEKYLQNLEVGATVVFDIGQFITEPMLWEMNVKSAVKEALSMPAKVIAIVDSTTVAVQYQSGLKYKVNKVFLTSDGGLNIQNKSKALPGYVIKLIDDVVNQGFKAVSEDGGSAEICFMKEGAPPSIRFKSTIGNINWDSILKWLQNNSGWEVAVVDRGLLLVKGIPNFESEVMLGISPWEDASKTGYYSNSFSEGTTQVKAAAEPICEAETLDAQEERPDVQSFDDFQYLRLHDTALGRDVYFPYVLHGPHREPFDNTRQTRRASSRSMVVRNSSIKSFNVNCNFANLEVNE